MNYDGEKFLDKLYNNLYISDEVQYTKDNKDNRYEAIKKYLERLERVHSNATTEHKKELLKSLYHKKYVIKEDVLRDKIKKMNISISEDRLQEEINTVINAQKTSLNKWLDYLTSETAYYPTWAKYWAFQGMLKMGNYDEGIEGYQKRSKDTESPFVDANPEIIAKAIDTITKKLNKDEINDEELEKIINSGNFSKIYTLLEKRYKENVIEYSGNEGKWIKYNQGNKEDAKKLCDSLQNKNTHWCTASEDMAIKQLCGPYDDSEYGGDFYVYYTKDKKGNYTLPRMAIRMKNHDEIGEIRGILDGQNLEEEMLPILESKLDEMTFIKDKQDSIEKCKGLKELTEIYRKTIKKEKLPEEEVNNLYTKQYGFGWTQDPKVDKIIINRNINEDFPNIKNHDLKFKIFQKYKERFNKSEINDKKFMLEAVKQDVFALEYASEELKNDKEVVLEAVKQRGSALAYASNDLKKDKEVVLIAVKQNGWPLRYANIELKNDKEIVLAAVKENGQVLFYASENLKKDKEVVLAAVRNSGSALEDASETLKKDKEVVLEAVKQNSNALAYASEELQNNKEVILAASHEKKLKNKSSILSQIKHIKEQMAGLKEKDKKNNAKKH